MSNDNSASLKSNDKKKIVKSYLVGLLGTLGSSILIFLAFKCFMSPNVDNSTVIISGGMSGFSRTIALIFEICGSKADLYLIYSVTYFILNIPSIIIGFKFGKKYGIFTLLNIVLVSLFTNFVNIPFLDEIAKNVACVINHNGVNYQAGILFRILIAAILNGSSTVLAYSTGTSAGGIDTISYFFAVRKSCSVSKPILIINSFVIFIFSVLTLVSVGSSNEGIATSLTVLIFAVSYQIIMNITIDSLSKINKKEQLQIITEKESVAHIVTSNTKHSCTIVKSKGAYSGKDKFIIYTTITVFEVNNIVNLIRKEDPESFIEISTIKRVYGLFVPKYSK